MSSLFYPSRQSTAGKQAKMSLLFELVDEHALFLPGAQGNCAAVKRDLVVGVEALPDLRAKALTSLGMATRSGSPVKVGKGTSVLFVGMEEMPRAVDGLIVECKAVALFALAVRALENGHLVREGSALEMQDPADARRVVGSVRLEVARIQRAAEALAHV